LRETDAPLEREGVVRAHQALQQADLILHILDASRPLAVQHPHLLAEAFRTPSATSVLLVWNKCDLPSAECITEQEAELRQELLRRSAVAPVRISALTGTGLEELRRAMTQQLGLAPQGPVHATVSERHRAELVLAAQALERAGQLLAAEQTELVLAATELRQGTEALGRILGRTYTQDLLDQIFTRFCLGK
jgi:tRNA modification GTPase